MNEMHLRNAWSCNSARKPIIWILAIRCIVLHTNLAFLVRARWAYFLETLLYFEKIQYATRDLPSVACQMIPDRFNCGRQIIFFDEAYRKIVRALKTGLAGICCVYKQSASVCASCVRIGGGWGMGGVRFRKKWFTLK